MTVSNVCHFDGGLPLPSQVYATVLSTDDYLAAALQMALRLRALRARHPMVVFVSAGVSDAAVQQLHRLGVPTRPIGPAVAVSDDTHRRNAAAGMGHWGFTFDKLRLFDQTEFTRIVYLDSDMLVLHAPDDLFDRPHLSAVASGHTLRPDWTDLNSGVLVIEPGRERSDGLIAHTDATRARLAARGVSGFGDQDILHTAHPDWPQRTELHLDERDNLFFADLHECVRTGRYHLGDGPGAVRIIHFAGPRKPWNRSVWWRDMLRALRPWSPQPARARALQLFRRSYRDALDALR